MYLEVEKKNVLLPWETEPGTRHSQPSSCKYLLFEQVLKRKKT